MDLSKFKFYYEEGGKIEEALLEELSVEFLSKFVPIIKYRGDLTIKLGSFFPVSYRGCKIFSSSKVANKMRFYENPYDGKYYKKETVDKRINEKLPKRPVAKLGFDFTASILEEDPEINRFMGIDSPSFRVSGGMRYKFGVEMETSQGFIPSFVYRNNLLNLECVKEGSLRLPSSERIEGVEIIGGEYVTGPLIGDTGFHNLYRSCKEVSSRCKVDRRCGFHVHIGYTQFSKEFIILSYILAEKMEKEFFSIVPPSRKGNSYCQFLYKHKFDRVIKEHGYKYGIEIAYDHLFVDVANGKRPGPGCNKRTPHPQGRYTGQYGREDGRDGLYRYMWFNIVPSIFNMKRAVIGNEVSPEDPFTLEFRHHSATTSFLKIKNFVLICMCFTNFVENNRKRIIEGENITLEELVRASPLNSRRTNDLINYIGKRKSKFSPKEPPQQIEDRELDEDNSEKEKDKLSLKDLI